MTNSVGADIREDGSRDALIAQWKELFGRAPAAKTGQRLMARMIAHELQVKAEGGLSPAFRRRLQELATGRASTKIISAGSQLVREWNGEQHVVDVVPDGFRWKGRVYKSLTAVAEAITGAKWSGPRFFGLRQ